MVITDGVAIIVHVGYASFKILSLFPMCIKTERTTQIYPLRATAEKSALYSMIDDISCDSCFRYVPPLINQATFDDGRQREYALSNCAHLFQFAQS